MTKKLSILILCFLLVTGLGYGAMGSDNTLASDTIKVKVTVPVIQRVEVVKPTVVEFDYPWDGANNGDPLVVENAGALKVKSNADWALQLDSFSSGNFEVLARRAEDKSSNWRPVSGHNSYFYGESGSKMVEFDLKILPIEGVVEGETAGDSDPKKATHRVQLSYTLEQN